MVRSVVENKSSPTVLMRDVTGFSTGVLVVSPFGIPATVDRPLIPVTSNAAIVITDSFLRFIIFVFIGFASVVEIYGLLHLAIFSRFDIIEIGDVRKMRFSDLDMLCAGTFVRLEAGSVLETS